MFNVVITDGFEISRSVSVIVSAQERDKLEFALQHGYRAVVLTNRGQMFFANIRALSFAVNHRAAFLAAFGS